MTGPARNRVTPRGEIIAVAGRGAWMGNRGRLHEGRGTRDIVRNHQSKTWITCKLEFKGRHISCRGVVCPTAYSSTPTTARRWS